jgi:uncharacterized RDD family membrane protein YckC
MINIKYRTGLKRFGAAIVDGIVFMPLLLLEQWLFNKTGNNSIIIGWTILTAFLPIFYSVILHYKYGQTIGKWVTGVKVLDISETNTLTLKQSIFRDSFYLAVEIIGLLYFSFLVFQTNKPDYLINDYKNFANQPILWWTLLELITMLTNNKRRAVHDFIAKSVVVRT